MEENEEKREKRLRLQRWEWVPPKETYAPIEISSHCHELDNLIFGKAAILGRRLEELGQAVFARETLLEDHLDELVEDECRIDSRIDHLLAASSDFADTPTMAMKKAKLYQQLAEILSEKRSQKLDAWADISRMQKEIFEVAKLYEDAKRREHLWGEMNGD
jgi:hypothetical protein